MKKIKKKIEDIASGLGIPQSVLDNLFAEQPELTPDWIPLSISELKVLPESEYISLLSYCWHDGEERCSTIGIYDLVITDDEINWSDGNGDPSIDIMGLETNTKINNIGDGTWNYGLFRKK